MSVANIYAKAEPARKIQVEPAAEAGDSWDLESSSGWFDLSITIAESPVYLRRFAGHVETGRPSTSDPGILT